MPSTRLFLGGLSEKANRQDIGTKLSPYGRVLTIDLKEKADPEGNVLFRFAYVNVDADPSQVEQCIQQLNGTSWKGSSLRVERAKESFLERLNRERAARQQGEDKAHHVQLDNYTSNAVPQVGETEEYSKDCSAFSEKQVCNVNDRKHSSKRKDCNTLERDLSRKNILTLHGNDQDSQVDTHLGHSKREKKKKHEVEEKMMSSFKNFSSVWADSDNENNEGDIQAGHSKSYEEQKDEVLQKSKVNEDMDATGDEDSDKSVSGHSNMVVEEQTQVKSLESLEDTCKSTSITVGEKSTVSDKGKRQHSTQAVDHLYNVDAAADKLSEEKSMPTTPEGNKVYVKVAKDLSFGQNTTGFSLLDRFSRLNQKEIEKAESVALPTSVPRTLITVQQRVKKRPFFIVGDDPELESAIEWMTQPITPEIIKEFEEALPDLRQVIRTRSFRAKKEEGDLRAQRHGPRRGRGRGQSRGRPGASDTGNPYRDHRWRERAVKK